MSNNHENTPVGAAGVPPVPNSNKNPQPNVVAGLDPLATVAAGPVPADQPDNAQACITRPDDKCYENILDCAEMGIHEFSSKMAKDLDEVRGQMQSIKNYIQHLEHQLTVAQNQNNLSLTTLRAERDALLTDKQILDALEKSFAPVFSKHNINVFQIRAAGPYGVDPHGFNVEDHKSVRHAIAAFFEIELQS